MTMEKLIERIDRALMKKIEKAGAMGTEVVRVSLELTKEEKDIFYDIEKYNSDNYSWDLDGNTLTISYREEVQEMTKEMVLKNLKELEGKEFDTDEVICAFEDFEEGGETSVYVGDSHNAGYDKIAYINTVDSTEFYFVLDGDVIKEVWMR